MLFERDPLKKRGAYAQGMDGGADVIHKTGKRQLRRAAASPHRLLPLDDENGPACGRQRDRCGEAVRAGADDHRVVGLARHGLILP
jgi:hypothetical protein